jgi:CubicO group peptidase (beta-lactamase class C family)
MLLGQVIAKLRGTSYIDAVSKHIATPLGLNHTRLAVGPLASQPADEARYTDITMPILASVMDADQRQVPAGYGNANFPVVAAAGGISSAVVDMVRILAALNLTAPDNPLLAPSEINAMFNAATATITRKNGTVTGMRGHGWDSCSPQSGGGFYAQKGGLWHDDQSCVRHSPNDISMAVAWGHWLTGGDWYPDFPEVINAAAAHDWGTTDLFPTFGMPSLQ